MTALAKKLRGVLSPTAQPSSPREVSQGLQQHSGSATAWIAEGPTTCSVLLCFAGMLPTCGLLACQQQSHWLAGADFLVISLPRCCPCLQRPTSGDGSSGSTAASPERAMLRYADGNCCLPYGVSHLLPWRPCGGGGNIEASRHHTSIHTVSLCLAAPCAPCSPTAAQRDFRPSMPAHLAPALAVRIVVWVSGGSSGGGGSGCGCATGSQVTVHAHVATRSHQQSRPPLHALLRVALLCSVLLSDCAVAGLDVPCCTSFSALRLRL